MPDFLKHWINVLCGPEILISLSIIGFFLALRFYRVVTKPAFALTVFAAVTVLFVMSLSDAHFRSIVQKGDNIPIVGMMLLLGFFLWLSLRQAAVNDERMEKGLPPREKEESNTRVLVWPDLVYSELIALVGCLVLLLLWSIAVRAPLEPPANPGGPPNPSKAPWYFLGLQEQLVYFDPWLAGVVFPGMIVAGLCAIPYVDRNPKGMGYYTLKERPFAITFFLFGFLILWVLLVVLGTFLRGPNWNFFGPFEVWDVHKVLVLNNVNLSEFFWIRWLETGFPVILEGSGDVVRIVNAVARESVGLALVGGYLAILPPLFAKTFLKRFYAELGFIRYNLVMNLTLMMMLLPIKMVLRWTFNLKYIVAIPEYFFNI